MRNFVDKIRLGNFITGHNSAAQTQYHLGVVSLMESCVVPRSMGGRVWT